MPLKVYVYEIPFTSVSYVDTAALALKPRKGLCIIPTFTDNNVKVVISTPERTH